MYYTLGELRTRARLSEQDVTEVLDISLTTWRRWQRQGTAPKAQQTLLEILAGRVPWTDWQGWEINAGLLVDPSSSIFLQLREVSESGRTT